MLSERWACAQEISVRNGSVSPYGKESWFHYAKYLGKLILSTHIPIPTNTSEMVSDGLDSPGVNVGLDNLKGFLQPM